MGYYNTDGLPKNYEQPIGFLYLAKNLSNNCCGSQKSGILSLIESLILTFIVRGTHGA